MAPAHFMRICLDVTDLDREGEFWARALGLSWTRDASYPGGDVAGAGRTGLRLEQVDEPGRGKNRAHPDIYARSLDDLLVLGAAVVLPEGDDRHWTVMTDPEGNVFCAFLREPVPDARLHGLAIDSQDPERAAAWWSGVLDGTATNHPSGRFCTVEAGSGRPFTLDFNRTDEPRVGKNRMHWDVWSADLPALVARGATVLHELHELHELHDESSWAVLADPEGNEFCVFPPA